MRNPLFHIKLLLALLIIPVANVTASCDSNGTNFPGAGHGDKSLKLAWDKPVLREDGSTLSRQDIKAYLIVSFPKKQEKAFYNYMYRIDPARYSNIPPGFGLYLPKASISKLVSSNSIYTVLVHCKEDISFLINDMPADNYYFAISTLDTNGKYSEISETISISTQP